VICNSQNLHNLIRCLPLALSQYSARPVFKVNSLLARVVATLTDTNPGSSVVNALLKDGTFTPRAITRNPESETALKLKARGVEVVKGDCLDKASLVTALRGSEAVFGVSLRPLKLVANELKRRPDDCLRFPPESRGRGPKRADTRQEHGRRGKGGGRQVLHSHVSFGFFHVAV
jgi:hypothetical protein